MLRREKWEYWKSDLKAMRAYVFIAIVVASIFGLYYLGLVWIFSEPEYPYELFKQFKTVGIDSNGQDVNYWDVTEVEQWNSSLPDSSAVSYQSTTWGIESIHIAMGAGLKPGKYGSIIRLEYWYGMEMKYDEFTYTQNGDTLILTRRRK